jgi:curved DNA-binding protein CbpA
VQASRDHYKLLGVTRESSPDDIRNAHRKLVRKYHPDANPGDRSAEERFKEIQEAYEILSNPDRRREYDRKLGTPSRRTSSGGPRTRAGGTNRRETAATVDLSDLLSKLADLSSERSSVRKEGHFQLQGEEVARLAKRLGLDITRISELVGKDITHVSKLVGENLKMDAKVSPGDAQSSGRPSQANNRSQSSGAKVVRTPRKGKRVKGPKARGRRRNN